MHQGLVGCCRATAGDVRWDRVEAGWRGPVGRRVQLTNAAWLVERRSYCTDKLLAG